MDSKQRITAYFSYRLAMEKLKFRHRILLVLVRGLAFLMVWMAYRLGH